MDHVIAVGVKFIAVTAVLWIVMDLSFGVMTFNQLLLTSAVLTVLSYGGDVTVMPKVSNLTASITDVVLAFIIIWVAGIMMGLDITGGFITGAAVSAVIIGIVEYLYHIYLLRNVLKRGNRTSNISVKEG